MRLKNWHGLALISCAVLVVYYPVLFVPLNSIDDVRMVHELLNRTEFSYKDFLVPTSKSFYRPLVNSSFIVDRFLWNLETSFLHLENLLIHLLNSLLVFGLTRRVSQLCDIKVTWVPFVAALIFGLHPVNTEAVIWVAGRADLLAGCFILLSVFCALNFYMGKGNVWVVLTMVSFFIGCLAKETTLFVWPGLVLGGFLVYRRPVKVSCSTRWPIWKAQLPALSCGLSIVGYFYLRLVALHNRDFGIRHLDKVMSSVSANLENVVSSVSPEHMSLLAQLKKIFSVFGFYARKLVQPFPLNFGIVDVPEYYWIVGGLLFVFCVFMLCRLSWEKVFFLTAVSLTSVAILVAFGGISWTPVAERYMYSPSAMSAIGLSLFGARCLRKYGNASRNRFFYGCIGFVLIVFSVGVFQRTLVWQNNITLFEDTINKSPTFAMARNELALALVRRGDRERGIDILRNIEIPDFQVASLNKVMVMIEDGEYLDARDFLVARLDNPGAYRRVILERLVKTLELLRDNEIDATLRASYQLDLLTYLNELWLSTREPFYLYRMGHLQMSMGERDKARYSFSKAYKLFPEESLYKKPSGTLAEVLKNP